MTVSKSIAKFALVILGWLGTGALAYGAEPNTFEFSEELDACVAALNEELDLKGVSRVRHIVTDYDSRGRGYTLKISTETYSKSSQRRYLAICVANGSQVPTRLSISESAS